MNAPLESPPTTRDSNEAAAWRPAPPPKTAAEATEEALYEVRRKIYPRSITGAFSSWRVWLVILTQLVYYGTPWLQWNDRQAVLFDLGARKFYIFGLVPGRRM
jgi:hypothetical protein